MAVWETSYKGHTIKVENTWFGGERLLVDGELQDEQRGFDFRSRLYGAVKGGEGDGEEIKVSLGGWVGVACRIFVANTLVLPQTRKPAP